MSSPTKTPPGRNTNPDSSTGIASLKPPQTAKSSGGSDATNSPTSESNPLNSTAKGIIAEQQARPKESSPVPIDFDNPVPVPSSDWPHVNSSTNKPLLTIENFAFMLVFYRIRVTYNVISKRVDVFIPGLKGSPDNIDNAALAIIISLASLNQIGSGNLMMYIGAIANENSRNPIQEWIHSKVWDGEDRVSKLIATLEIADGYSLHLRDILVRRWLLSAGAAVLVPGFRSRGVLTLQGPQSIGKSAWVHALLPLGLLRDTYIKLDHHLDPSNKDSQITAICHWIVEIGELDSSFKKDIARLKGFITAASDKVRVPYGRRASEFARRTVFVATVNTDQFLVDETGNTRWWTVSVKSLNYGHDIDVQQLWAQVAHILEHEQEQWWLTEHEEALLESYNRQFMRSSVVADLLDSCLDWSATPDKYSLNSATDVLKMIGIDRPTNPQARDCGAELRSRLGPPRKSHGKTLWNVPPAIQVRPRLDKDEY